MKKIFLILALTLFTSVLVTPVFAAEEVQKQILPTSPLYFLVKAKESVQQFLTFNQNSKAQLLENFAAQRIKEVEYANFTGDEKALTALLDRYQTQKTQVLGYVKGVSDSKLVEVVKEGTVAQQQTLTQMQLQIEGSPGVAQRVVEVQKEIAGEVKNTVEVIEGTEEAAEIENKLHYVWLDPNADASGKLPPLPDEIGKWEYAPGTEGRDEKGRVVEFTVTTEGGVVEVAPGEKVQIQWAPGTEGAGESGVKYEGGPQTVVEGGPTEGGGGAKKVVIQEAPGGGKTKVEVAE